MPRRARTKSESGIYHIMLRGVNRQTIFEDDEDKMMFLETLGRYTENYELYGYCLMDNHVHLLVKEEEESISMLVKKICSSYVYWYNRKYFRCGHLFQERFKSENVENTNYFLIVLRYIHQNPLKASLVNDVFESKWTSIHEYTARKKIVDVDIPLRLFSSERKMAIQLFMEFMKQSNDDQCLDDTQNIRVSDNEVRNYMNKYGITSSTQLQHLEKENRDAILAQLKQMDGVTIRQLARVTGISKSVVQRV